MTCTHCGAACAADARFCGACGEKLNRSESDVTVAPTLRLSESADATLGPSTPRPPLSSDATIDTAAGAAPSTGGPTLTTTGVASTATVGSLQIGPFGTRYHIIRMLGAGGMGAVYHAWDDELGVAVALKVIRPERLGDPAAAADLERRLKRELVLARQITHPNVVRIHDLGEVNGIKYLTMPFIQGSDLASVLRAEGKLPTRRALRIARQILEGLGAAHRAGVVHRDLKPANVMVDADDHACIMDFGIARAATPGATMATAAGAVLGTVAYMAPEQARGEVVDQRADVYSFGLILRDMLVGLRAAAMGDGAISELMARMTTAPSTKGIDRTISDDLDGLITRCLEPSPDRRYQDAIAVLVDLMALDEDGRSRRDEATILPAAPKTRHSMRALVAAAAIAAALLSVGVWRWSSTRESGPTVAVAQETLTMAVLPFRNATGDPTLDPMGASIAEILRAELGQSNHLRTAAAGRVQQTLLDLRLNPGDALNDAMLRRVADHTSAQAVIWGQFVKAGEQIQVIASMQDLRRSGAAESLHVTSPNEAAMLGTMAQLAEQVRQRVARSPDALKELQASSVKPSTQSFSALNEYHRGVELARAGSHAEAVKHFSRAIEEDEQFAVAFSRLAQSYANLGQPQDAERASRQAVSLMERASAYERSLIEATHARVLNDTKRAVAALEGVVKVLPADTEALYELGRLYENSGALEQAHGTFAKLLEHDPKSVDALLAFGRVLINLQKTDESLDHLNRALSLSIALDKEEARGSALQALGIAYKQLGKPADALRHYEQALEIRRKRGQQTAIAASLNEIGQVQTRLGQHEAAIRSYREALRIRREIGDKRGVGTVLINMASFYQDRGQLDDALPAIREALQIQREVGNQALEALCLNSLGSIYHGRAQYDDALTYFERALALREKLNVPGDLADTLHNVAEASVRVGQFDQALAYYLRALDLRRKSNDARAVAIESFSTATVFEWQGRFGAALKARQEAYETLKQANDRSFWYATVATGYGATLSRVGRSTEAQPLIAEGLATARMLKNDGLVAEALAVDAERLLLNGEADRARTAIDAALTEVKKTTDRQMILTVRLIAEQAATDRNLARATRLAALASEADTAGFRHLALEASIARADTLVLLKQYAPAQREIERVLGRIENLHMRLLQAKAHTLLMTIYAASGHPAEARRQQTQARRLFEELRKDAGTDRILSRADIAQAFKAVQAAS